MAPAVDGILYVVGAALDGRIYVQAFPAQVSCP
jgi:hypothetical protein